jgi:hypothetical protein
MKPIYSTNEELMCGEIKYNNRTYLVDFITKDKLINSKNKFVFVNENDIYPSYVSNYKRVNYLSFVFNYNSELDCCVFKNNNQYDLRRKNVELYHHYHKQLIENKKYEVTEYIEGHYYNIGHDANIMKNPIWRVKEKDNGKEYLLMYCEKDTVIKLCDKSYQVIKDYEKNLEKNLKNKIGRCLTWYKCKNGYIQTHNYSDEKIYYIHQIITGCHGNGKGTKNVSVDHIDQDPLNNTFDNLRIATRKEQEQNCNGTKDGTKRARKTGAKDLPEGIEQDMMKKYVVYYHEWLDKENTKPREYFKVEKHPKLDKPWIGTKSGKVSIMEKLKQANKIVDNLEKDLYPETENVKLPKYVSLVVSREKPHLVFEKRIDGKRLGLKMILPEDYDLQEQLAVLNDKIKKKYSTSETGTDSETYITL